MSCVRKEEQLPKDVISEDKMVDVITEIELTQALVKLKFSNRDSTINQQELFNQVYTDFNITEEKFNNSLSYYCQSPEVIENIYMGVINKLSEKQAQNN